MNDDELFDGLSNQKVVPFHKGLGKIPLIVILIFCIMMVLLLPLFIMSNSKAGTVVDTSNKEVIEFSITKNDKIKVLEAATVSTPRKITTTYWILCIDGVKFVALTQSSGADIVQLFEENHTPVKCGTK